LSRRRTPRLPRGLFATRRGRSTAQFVVLVVVLALAIGIGGANLVRVIADEAAHGAPALERRADGWYLVDIADAAAVEVESIVDGDTLDVQDADGEVFRVRVFGIDTPERGDRCHREATDGLAAIAGAGVLLLEDERHEDSGGRQLRYLFTPDGRSIDAELVDDGLALAWREDGAYRDQLVAIEEAARAAGIGCLWSAG
jgi:micrococcal nuclease